MTDQPLAQAAQIESKRVELQREWQVTQERMQDFIKQHDDGTITDEQLQVAREHFEKRRQRIETFMADRRAFYAHYTYLTPDDLVPPKPKHVPQPRSQDETWSVRGRSTEAVSYSAPELEEMAAQAQGPSAIAGAGRASAVTEAEEIDQPKSSRLGLAIVAVLTAAIIAVGALVIWQLVKSQNAPAPAAGTSQPDSAPQPDTSEPSGDDQDSADEPTAPEADPAKEDADGAANDSDPSAQDDFLKVP